MQISPSCWGECDASHLMLRYYSRPHPSHMLSWSHPWSTDGLGCHPGVPRGEHKANFQPLKKFSWEGAPCYGPAASPGSSPWRAGARQGSGLTVQPLGTLFQLLDFCIALSTHHMPKGYTAGTSLLSLSTSLPPCPCL